MPNDPYQIGEDNSGITLVLSDRGVSTPSAHASSHLTGGSDAIQLATTSQVGLMSAAFATKLTGIPSAADVTATALPAAVNALPTENTPLDADAFVMWDASATGSPKRCTLSTFRTYLDDTFATLQSAQTVASKTLLNCTMSGGALSGVSIPLGTNTVTGVLPVANGGTGAISATGTGFPVLQTGPQLIEPLLGTPASGILTNCTGLPIANTTGTLSVAKGGTGATALSAGVVKSNGTVLSSSAIDLTSAEVTGVLPVTKGGTGASTLSSGVIKSNGTVLSSSAVGLTTEVTGVLPIANGGTSYSQHPYGQISGQIAGDLITGAGITVFSKLGIVTTLGAANLFDAGSPSGNNVLRYTGTQMRQFLIFASTDIMSSVLGDTFAIKLSKNGILIDATECQARTAGKTSNYLAKLVTNWIVELSLNDYLELWVASPAGDSGTPQRMRLVATPV
jgi:hypothetical protein